MAEDRVRALLRDFYEAELERDRVRRLDKVSEFRATMDARVRKQALCEAIEGLNRGDFEWVMEDASRMMAALGVSYDFNSIEYRELCHQLLRVHTEAIRRAIERDEGNWAGKPSDPLLVGFPPAEAPAPSRRR